MNERFRLNGSAVREWLKRTDRKQSFLVKALNVSGSLVGQMLSGHVPQIETVEALAQLMGVEVQTLLIPKEAKVG